MKKSLIALSLAALPVAAFADVTLYGQIKGGVEVSQTKVKEGGVTTKDHTKTEIADFGSRIGFKGHEHVGNNLNAIWKVEQKTSIAGTDKGWGNREAYIGLEGGFGTIRAGKIATQLDDMGTIDPWEYNNNALGLGVFTRTATKVVSARYDTPVFGGFSANVQYTPRDNQTEARGLGTNVDGTGRTNNLGDTSAYYAGLNYENSGFFAQYGLGYKKSAYVANNASKSGQVHRVEAGYDANNLFVGLGYQYTNGWDSLDSYAAAITNTEYTDADRAADDSAGVKTHEAAITGAYRFGNVTPRLSYAHGFKAKTASGKVDGTQYKQVVVGADYDFSKRTTAMVSAGWLKAGSGENKAETTAGLVGLRHKF
ncbi:trimeric porin PorB [Neisseria dentiae]|uniref:trimeric porin PorB n=1 Tax=Neisseria dentiae TaxID=194197 RepID=UPI00211B9F69|nr:trimeric porin PorB [Neisseria dentiae]MCQ9326718.1 trimeric porin PorB [Neisseria dentiae]